MSFRIGQGYDVHRLVAGRRLVLGGVEIDSPLGLEGHSDADVLLHALGDALLGGAGLGDLGEHFPPAEERWRDADSAGLISAIMAMLAARGFSVVNCDLTLVGEQPRLAPYRDRIRERVAALLGVTAERVGLKATTNERLGALGRGEGLAALAAVLLAAPD
jgi:2-C-methyl-D-erythritol 2,4-cyclodiphosphate synthase